MLPSGIPELHWKPPRALRFPRRPSLGMLATRDANSAEWRLRGPARGTVRVAKGTEVRLDIYESGVQGLADLRVLEPCDLQGLNFMRSGVRDEHLAYLAGLTGLEGLDLGDTAADLGVGQISDRGVSLLAPLTQLRGLALRKSQVCGPGLAELACTPLAWLDLGETPLSDRGVLALRRFSSLEGLSVRRTAITDNAAETISLLPKLRRLDVSDVAIGDRFLESLRFAGTLEWLSISSTKITDEGLLQVGCLRSLQMLDLWQCAVSESAVRALQRSLPDCAIAF